MFVYVYIMDRYAIEVKNYFIKKFLAFLYVLVYLYVKGSPKGRKIHLFMKTFSKIDRSPQLLAFYLNKVYTKKP